MDLAVLHAFADEFQQIKLALSKKRMLDAVASHVTGAGGPDPARLKRLAETLQRRGGQGKFTDVLKGGKDVLGDVVYKAENRARGLRGLNVPAGAAAEQSLSTAREALSPFTRAVMT